MDIHFLNLQIKNTFPIAPFFNAGIPLHLGAGASSKQLQSLRRMTGEGKQQKSLTSLLLLGERVVWEKLLVSKCWRMHLPSATIQPLKISQKSPKQTKSFRRLVPTLLCTLQSFRA